MKILDLFSGIGGFSLAGRWAGCTTIQFVEIDKFCQKVLAKNFPGIPIAEDIRDFHFVNKVDLLTAGFPCQPFSVAGKRKGKEDERYLWPEVIRIIHESQPSWVILENVPGIIPVIDPVFDDLENESYDWRAFLIPASGVGAPHKRERIWIVAYRNKKRCNDRNNYREKRSIPDDWQWNLSPIYSEWPQRFPESWTTFKAQEWLTSRGYSENGDKPPVSGVDDGLPDLVDRNKALGNAIVPQIAYILISLIKELNFAINKDIKENRNL